MKIIFPNCPNCSKAMTFGRLVPGTAVFRPVNSFNCHACKVATTEAVPDEEPLAIEP